MPGAYEHDHDGVGEMLRSDFLLAEMVRRAVAGQSFAESIAPVDEGGPHPGRYKEAFDVDSGVLIGHKTRRAFADLVNTSPEAFYVEVGTQHNEAHHVLVKSLEVMGE